MQQQRDQVGAAGDKWLNSLPESRRAQVLGRKGLKAWEDGEDWRKYMRGYAGLRVAESRVFELMLQFHADEILQANKDNGIIRTTDRKISFLPHIYRKQALRKDVEL